jgi:hypothetical protein
MASTLSSAYAGGKISSDDETKWVSVGMGVRTEFQAVEDQSANKQTYDNSFGINNAPVYINGQIHKYLKFEFNTECFNCAKGQGGVMSGSRGRGPSGLILIWAYSMRSGSSSLIRT